MTYGLPYMGSKNKIAEDIISIFPSAENFYDLFSGGGSIVECAFLSGKFKNIYYNDYDKSVVEYFSKSINGEYKDRLEWVNKETFYKDKASDPFIKYVWSFHTNGKDYLYGKNVVNLKYATYQAILHNDFEPAKQIGLDLTCIKDMDNIEDKAKTVSKIIKSITSNTTNDVIARKKRVDNVGKVFNQTSLFPTKPNIFITNKSYKDVEIKPNSVIYCDPPYNNSRKYVCTSINYDEFYNWCLQQKQPLFISEYSMPDDFVCIKEIKRSFSVYTTSQTVALEKVFRPKSQV